jgi:two-component system cell cycle sensor histidine kinase/response regulator CckA
MDAARGPRPRRRPRQFLLYSLAAAWVAGAIYFVVQLELREDAGGDAAGSVLRLGGLILQLLIAGSATAFFFWTRHQRRLDRLEAQRAEEFRQLFHDASEPMFVVDSGLVVIEINAAACSLSGFTREELLGRSLTQLLTAEELAARPMRLDELRQGKRLVIERSVQHKDGSQLVVEFSTQQLPDGRILGIARDISQRRALEEMRRELLQGQKMEALGRLAGGVAHDFNNLLGIILGYSDLLAATLAEGSEGREQLDEVRRAVLRAAELTRQLLAFSRRQVLAVRVLELDSVLEDSRKMLSRVLPSSIDIRFDVAPDLGRVRADETQLVQVLMNLAVNSRDAMPAGGVLGIEAANVELDAAQAREHNLSPGRYVRLRVRDSGRGMTPEVLEHAFEPFFTTKETASGAGLGLAAVYGIAQQLDGAAEIESSPARGTVVTLYLPRSEGPMSGEVALAEVQAAASVHERILVVEDLAPLRKLVERMLTRIGYQVLSAASAQEALELAGKGDVEIDLLLSDIVMPGMDGRDLARLLKATRPGMRVVLMTGYSELLSEMGEADELGADAVIQKPFSPLEIERLLADVLAGSEAAGR